MKNCLITLLVLLVGILAYRDATRIDPSTADVAKSSTPLAQKKDDTAILFPEKLTENTLRGVSEAQRTEAKARQVEAIQKSFSSIRWETLKLNALFYSRYFAKSNLPKEKASLLMELLVDRVTGELEPSVQPADNDVSRLEKNNKMIEELVGKEALAEIERSRENYLADQHARSITAAIFGQQQISEEKLTAVSEMVKDYNPADGMTIPMTEKGALSPEQESAVRTLYRQKLSEKIHQMEHSLDRTELANFAAWSDSEFEKSISLLKMVRADSSEK